MVRDYASHILFGSEFPVDTLKNSFGGFLLATSKDVPRFVTGVSIGSNTI